MLIGDNDNCFVAPIVTLYRRICYKIDPKFKIPDFNSVILKLYLNEINTEKPINLVMYLTSPDATLNLATDIWPQFLPGEIKLPFDATRKKTVISYRNVDYTFKTGVENSSECVTEIIKKSKCKIVASQSVDLHYQFATQQKIIGVFGPITLIGRNVCCRNMQWHMFQKRMTSFIMAKNLLILRCNSVPELRGSKSLKKLTSSHCLD